MRAKQRDYRAEYARRIAQGERRGLSRSQARGHPGVGEGAISRRQPPRYDQRLEEGLKAVRDGRTLKEAANSVHAAPETLRNYLVRTGVAEKPHNRWRIGADPRLREVEMYSGGRRFPIRIKGYDAAFEWGRYMAAVGQMLDRNDASVLEPFVGRALVDAKGRSHPFETRPNVLYRLKAGGDESFEQVYRIVVLQ